MWVIHCYDSRSQPAACSTSDTCWMWSQRGQRSNNLQAWTRDILKSSSTVFFLLFLRFLKFLFLFPLVQSGHSPHTGLITPTFGIKGNEVQRGPVPARPVPQPHPKDEDSLVQMAEHIPAGTRTPMCAHCNIVIRRVTNVSTNVSVQETVWGFLSDSYWFIWNCWLFRGTS